MNNDDTEIEEMVEEVLVCGDCGRVNYVLDSVTRSTAVRCSGCSALLRAERPRPVRVDCPVCHEEVEVESNKAGQMARCGNCGADFELAGDGKAAPRAVRPGVADDDDDDDNHEEIVDEQGRVRRVRRTRKKKKMPGRTGKELVVFILSWVVTLGLVGGVITEVGRRSGWWLKAPPPPPPTLAETVKAAVEEPTARMGADEATSMYTVLQSFFGAPSPEMMLGYCRFPGEVGERMRRYYARRIYEPLVVGGLTGTVQEQVGERLFLRLDGQARDGRNFSVVVERLAPKKFLVDWDSYVRYSSADWDLFVSRKPPETQRFQLFARRDLIGNADYPIERFTAFYVYWKGEEDGVPMFVRRDSNEEFALLAATEPQRKRPVYEPSTPPVGVSPVTLEVAFKPESNVPGKPPAMELRKFIHDGWVNTSPGEE